MWTKAGRAHGGGATSWWAIGLAIGLAIAWLVGWPLGAAQAAPQALANPLTLADAVPPVSLTLEGLRDRLKQPTVMDGRAALDLSQTVLDLRPENAAFRNEFYDQVRSRLAEKRLSLDLAGTIVRGDLDASKLGLRAPLYGKSLSPTLTPAEQEQLGRDRLRLLQLGRLSRSLLLDSGSDLDLQISVLRGSLRLNGAKISGTLRLANTYFLSPVEARGVTVGGAVVGSLSRFSGPVSFSGASLGREVQFRNSIFSNEVRFDGTRFTGAARFTSASFEKAANFYRAQFSNLASFTKSHWRGSADFTQVDWQGEVSFEGARFDGALYAIDSLLAGEVSLRNARFAQPVNLRGAAVLGEVDFTSASFGPGAYLNVSGLDFDPERAKLIGSPGQIGRVLSVPILQGNDTLLRSLIRNFRRQEQIDDANQIAYLQARLEIKFLERQLVGVDLNTARPSQLTVVGFSSAQAAAIVATRDRQPLRNPSELLSISGIDLATYVKVRDRVTARAATSPGDEALGTLVLAGRWAGTSLLLLLSRNGTSPPLVLGTGLVAITYFALIFWAVDRLRKFRPKPVWPPWWEVAWMLGVGTLLGAIGLTLIFRTGDRPWLTLACMSAVLVPVPGALVTLLYRRGRYHGLMDESYLVENSDRRQIQLLIARLPNMPRYYFFRERFLPILWNRGWAWLNYYDFSLNNWLRIGFNDLRMRDEELPGLVCALVWYQWSLGLLYIALLLWTLSRAIPGLNLLIYFG